MLPIYIIRDRGKLMYTREESFKLITAVSSKIEEKEKNQKQEYNSYLCKNECFNLVSAQSSKIKDSVPESILEKLYSSWKFEEVFALIANRYDPRNFGKVNFQKRAYSE